MWKVKIKYADGSELTLTGGQKDIPPRLAVKYNNEYIAGRLCEAVYQRYPKKDYPEQDFQDKLDEIVSMRV